jgi:hypothetical protein
LPVLIVMCAITELTNSFHNKNIRDIYRGITKFKKACQPRINLIKDERGDQLADPQIILNMSKNNFCLH